MKKLLGILLVSLLPLFSWGASTTITINGVSVTFTPISEYPINNSPTGGNFFAFAIPGVTNNAIAYSNLLQSIATNVIVRTALSNYFAGSNSVVASGNADIATNSPNGIALTNAASWLLTNSYPGVIAAQPGTGTPQVTISNRILSAGPFAGFVVSAVDNNTVQLSLDGSSGLFEYKSPQSGYVVGMTISPYTWAFSTIGSITASNYWGDGATLTNRYQPENYQFVTLPQFILDTWYNIGTNYPNEFIVTNAIIYIATNNLSSQGMVWIDDGWTSNSLSATGLPQYNPTFFPNGILPLSILAHQYGQQLGLYTSQTSGQSAGAGAHGVYPGTTYETAEANQLSQWGIDGIKVDNPANIDTCTASLQRWSDAIAKSGRNIILNETLQSLSVGIGYVNGGLTPSNSFQLMPIESTAYAANIWQGAQGAGDLSASNGMQRFYPSFWKLNPWAQREKKGNHILGIGFVLGDNAIKSNDVKVVTLLNTITHRPTQILGMDLVTNSQMSYFVSLITNNFIKQIYNDPLQYLPVQVLTNVAGVAMLEAPMSNGTNALLAVNLTASPATVTFNGNILLSKTWVTNQQYQIIDCVSNTVTYQVNILSLQAESNSCELYLMAPFNTNQVTTPALNVSNSLDVIGPVFSHGSGAGLKAVASDNTTLFFAWSASGNYVNLFGSGSGNNTAELPLYANNNTVPSKLHSDLIVDGKMTATNGYVAISTADIPSNSIPGYSGTATNWWFGSYVGALCAICTNNGANTYTIKQIAP